jgi:hypothetical protein
MDGPGPRKGRHCANRSAWRHVTRVLCATLCATDGNPVAAPGFGHASFPPRRDLADVIVAGKPDAAETAPHRSIDPVGAGVCDITDGRKG